jgi:hypothetical protein
MKEDYTYFLQKTIEGQIVWINSLNISETEKHRKIKSLIDDLKYSSYDFKVTCFNIPSQKIPNREGIQACTNNMVLTHKRWVCPACGHVKPAIKIHDIWFEN